MVGEEFKQRMWTSSTGRAKHMKAFNQKHLPDSLEDEAIYVIREVAASFENPIMLYSIGKDSSVLLHLARKAFSRKVPFLFCISTQVTSFLK